MKKTLLLTLALGLAGIAPLMAANVDVYITGSTAFRANVYLACSNLFASPPSIYYGDAAHGGADSGWNSGTASWAMTGTPRASLTELSGSTLTIHGLFTGSVQGIQTVEQKVKLTFAKASGTVGQLTSGYVTNSPTVGFSDASGASTPYPATGNYVEEDVCVQPFVMVKSSATIGAVTNINNVTWEQMEYGIQQGRIPLSAWTYKTPDTNKFVYVLERTADSGTRRCFTAEQYFQFNDPVTIYLFDYTNKFWYVPTDSSVATARASSPYGVVGPAGLNNANLGWGAGFVGGGDMRTSLADSDPANQAVAMLSIGDAKSLGSSNWANVISFNGIWPTTAGAGIHGNTGTNDFSPITLGYYSCWGKEVLVHPIDPALVGDQNITQSQLGDQYTPGTFMGVFNAQTAGTPAPGSIEETIESSKVSGATAIRLKDMANTRPSVGGTIFPPFN